MNTKIGLYDYFGWACMAVLVVIACTGCGAGQDPAPRPADIPNTAHGACAGTVPPPHCRPGGG